MWLEDKKGVRNPHVDKLQGYNATRSKIFPEPQARMYMRDYAPPDVMRLDCALQKGLITHLLALWPYSIYQSDRMHTSPEMRAKQLSDTTVAKACRHSFLRPRKMDSLLIRNSFCAIPS